MQNLITDFELTINDVDFPAIVTFWYEPEDASVSYSEVFSIEKVQLEVAENVWADLNSDHFHLVQDQIEEESKKQRDENNTEKLIADYEWGK